MIVAASATPQWRLPSETEADPIRPRPGAAAASGCSTRERPTRGGSSAAASETARSGFVACSRGTASRRFALLAAVSFALIRATSALAAGSNEAAGIEFGNNLSEQAFNGICDDPRFRYTDGRAEEALSGENMFHDAADCFQKFIAEQIVLREPGIPGIDLGGDGETFGLDYRCQDPDFVIDPRREARGAGDAGAADAKGQDATDCFRAYLAGEVWPLHAAHRIAFGDDSGEWPLDDQCDDPRFEGDGMAAATVARNVLADRTDCLRAFERDNAGADGRFFLTTGHRDHPEVNFGDDSGRWSFDGECDDPRFEGKDVMADTLLRIYILRDATDCFRAYRGGKARATEVYAEIMQRTAYDDEWSFSDEDGFEFGNDSGRWSFDGDCDDPRFDEADGEENIERVFIGGENVRRDATDCYREFLDNLIVVLSDTVSVEGFDFGDDSGRWPFDGECDDPRFKGDGMANQTNSENEAGDATDCRRAFRTGSVTIK